MTITRTIVLLGCAAALAGCESNSGGDKTRDRQFIGQSSLQDLSPGIWVDPRGCDHWLIDDGVEGYLSQRLSPDGKPVCSGTAPPEYVTGPFRGGQDVSDPL
ncbi:hypothetical protein [Jannaschia ovalis]|uniref:Lipoprotein n=1 Tax=Jannaschia ovalis TaxID=3038773 RepID=A0ABY8LDC1_9RHOB|nr:hypothetical protein [Jannaschia sp. GRR-S6-38]WGH79309.1 hypothetical protein P8627_03320 [Jannaschia sp. GRR-S6-38]